MTEVSRTALLMAAIVGLAALATHPAIRTWERRLGLSLFAAAGAPFLLIGALMGPHVAGVLTPAILDDLRPALDFALGWIGFVVGMRLDVRRLGDSDNVLPRAFAIAAIPALAAAAVIGACLSALGIQPAHGLFRTLLVAGAAGAATLVPGEASAGLRRIAGLADVFALAGLGAASLFARPDGPDLAWHLPLAGWVLITLGLGTLLGVITYLSIRSASSRGEELALLVGSVALTAGVGSYLSLSVPVVCAIAGATAANLPVADIEGLAEEMRGVLRPVSLGLLAVIGAGMDLWDWRGWLLAVAYAAARLLGKGAAAVLVAEPGGAAALAPRLVPQSPVATVALLSGYNAWYGDRPEAVGWTLTAVAAGGLLAEALVYARPESSK